MTSTDSGGLPPLASDRVKDDPTQMLIPGLVLSDDDEFGTLISATVADEYVAELGISTVLMRILPFGQREASILRDAVKRVSLAAQSQLILRYVGVWEISSNETWLVCDRRRGVSLKSLFANTQSQDIESVISYIAQACLLALQKLHGEYGQAHTNLRPANIYVSEECMVCFGDVGVYTALCECLKSRRSVPGMKIWPHPREKDISLPPLQMDLWDLGITILEIVDGGALLARMCRSTRRTPRLASPSKWSAQFNSFVAQLFSAATEKSLLCKELLNHRFVFDASSSACLAAMAEYMTNREELISGPYVQDTISTLFRQNTAVVQAPLISIDDISTDMFSYEHWNGIHQGRPTVEMSMLRMLRMCKEQPRPRDTEESKSLSRTMATIETFLEAADLQ